MLEKRDFFQGFFVILLRFDLEVKGHLGQGQRSRWSRSNKGTKERQMGSRQRQVASYFTDDCLSKICVQSRIDSANHCHCPACCTCTPAQRLMGLCPAHGRLSSSTTSLDTG